MYTQCPDCLTVFSLDADALMPAGGHVQCGHCQTVFDALACIASQLPPEPFQRLAPQAAAGSPPRLELAVYRPRPEPEPVVGADGLPVAWQDQEAAPRFARKGRLRGTSADGLGERRWPWVTVCMLLTLLLGAQVAWAQRNTLLSDPVTGAWLRQACSTLGCRLPLVRSVRQLHLIARDVEAHPSIKGALMISATFRNDAPFAQPYPVISLVLSDPQGHRVAMRRLRPAEYLDDSESLRAGMPPGATTAVVLEVEDPGRNAVAFEFGFE